jgi:hypothetical protein
MPYSGPASVYGTYGKAQAAFFRLINEHGGVNGRKIRLLSLDDAFSPPRTVEQVRKLVEQEQVLAIFSSFGTPTNTAIVKYAVMKPAGLEKSVGIISAVSLKDRTDSHWQNDPGLKEWLDFMKQYYPEGDATDLYNVYAYATARTLVQVLLQCGDDLTRENLMRQPANLKNLELPILIPGIRVNTGRRDYSPVEQMQLQRFDGKKWVLFGDIITP